MNPPDETANGNDGVRVARARHWLMCRPAYFDVTYSINRWMNPAVPTSNDLAVRQWQALYELLSSLGHQLDLIDPLASQPDMVYTANGATVVDEVVLLARFRHPERAGEEPGFKRWFLEQGYCWVAQAKYMNEGEGDFLDTGDIVLAGTGFRTEPMAHAEASEILGRPVESLTLVDPWFYHLDTALAVLDVGEIMYFPEAFSPKSQGLLAELFPDAIRAERADAEVFGLNAVSDGLNVVLPQASTALARSLRERGYRPHGVDVSELLKGGGGPKCCTLSLGSWSGAKIG
jgi:N-dimethylarginine dimethylaminohydrolase